MPRPPAPDEVCERAWELYAASHGWRDVARKLTAEGHPCTYETARQWGHRGKQLYTTKKDIDPLLQRYRFADFLGQWMGRLTELTEDAELEDILAILDRMKWMYEAHVKLVGMNAQPPPKTKNVNVNGRAEPQEFIQRMVEKAWRDPEETFGDPNGHR